jgi:hypothetical protein
MNLILLQQPIAAAGDRYGAMLDAAHDAAHRALERTDRIAEDARTSCASIGQDRVSGAVDEADNALALLAAADRYRQRTGNDPSTAGAASYAVQAAQDLEMGTRALRRAAALISDPDVDSNAVEHDSAVQSIGLADSHYRMADWALQNAPAAKVAVCIPVDELIS